MLRWSPRRHGAGMTDGLVSLDTNVIVRFLVNDEPVQAARARALIATHPVFITDTVLLETEWVLRAAYGKTQSDVLSCFRALLGLPGVAVRDPAAIAEALASYEGGLDFADALHVSTSGDAVKFATFDSRFAKRAGRLQGRSVVSP